MARDTSQSLEGVEYLRQSSSTPALKGSTQPHAAAIVEHEADRCGLILVGERGELLEFPVFTTKSLASNPKTGLPSLAVTATLSAHARSALSGEPAERQVRTLEHRRLVRTFTANSRFQDAGFAAGASAARQPHQV